MKTPVTALLLTLALSRGTETNYFEVLQAKNQNYTNARVTSVTSTHLIVWHDGGGSRVMLTNLSPELQARFGFDPDRAEAESKETSIRKERANVDRAIKGAALQHDREYRKALLLAQHAYETKVSSLLQQVNTAKDRVKLLRSQLVELKTQRDAAWNRYIYTDSSRVITRNGQTDNEATRLARAQALDREISNAQNAIGDAEEKAREIQQEYKDQHPKLKKEFDAQLKLIHSRFAPRDQEPVGELVPSRTNGSP